MKINREDYFDYNAVSSSMLKWILPEFGGSPRKYKYWKENGRPELTSDEVKLGKLAHRHLERPGSIVLVEVEKPQPAIATVCEELVERPEYLSIKEMEDVRELVYEVAKSLDYQPNWKKETIIDKVLNQGAVYIQALIEAKRSKGENKSKVLVSPEEKTKLIEIFSAVDEVSSILKTPCILFKDGAPTDDIQVFHEYPIAFVFRDVQCKALIDVAVVNHTLKKVYVFDLKTTSKPIPFFTGQGVIRNGIVHLKEGEIFTRGIDVQLVFYLMGLTLICNTNKGVLDAFTDGYRIEAAALGIVETLPPYDREYYNGVTESDLRYAKKRVEIAIDLIKGITFTENAETENAYGL